MDSAPSPTSRLSVVIPVHNRADLAAQCLAALARWTTPLEILVVDDGSTDPGVPLLHRTGLGEHDDHAWRWLRNPEARGFSAAINRGLAEATGDLLLLLNSDAEVTEGGDHRIRDAFTEDRRQGGRLGALAARLVYPNGLPQWSGGAFPTHLWLFALASGLGRGARLRVRKGPPSGFTGGTVDWAPGAALAISREAFEEVGPFDESYRHYAQDLDYCQRLARAGRKVRVLADWIVVHHLGGSVGQISDLASAHPSEAPDPLASSSAAAPNAGYDGQRLDLLWLDLLLWARRHRGARWEHRARRALLLGGRLRQLLLAKRRDAPEARAVHAAITAIAALPRSSPT
ncbi:MAG: glycosyltransferase family 2 protein [Thermoanaerobaculia bacterium]|nr:glycosyltransferase family 2 protein [Thermoanaerobaculia bacterium]